MPSRSWSALGSYLLAILVAAAVASYSPTDARAQSATWNVDADGNWSVGANWAGGVAAAGIDSVASFVFDITAARTVTLDQSFTVGSLVFNDLGANNDSNWNIVGGPAESITLQVTAGSPVITVTTPLGQASATIGAALAGNQGFTKNGPGRLILTGTNTFTGGVTISAGVLRANAVSLPIGNNLAIGGGVYESSGTFARNLGAGAGELRFIGNGGFSAAGGDLTVTLNGGALLEWSVTPDFLLTSNLVLGAANSTHRVDLTNSIELGAAQRTITVDGAAGIVNARITGDITGVSGITKNGGGVLELTGQNSYLGPTVINAGVLRGVRGVSIPNSNISLNGGILESNGTLFGAVGTGDFGIQFSAAANGGFSAAGGNFDVSFSDGATLVWGSTPGFLGTGNLLLGAASADGTVNFQNPLDFNGGNRTITVANGAAEIDARLSGALSNGGLTIAGNNGVVLELTGANTFAGGLTISNASVRFLGDAATALTSFAGNIALTSAGGGQTAVLHSSGTINRAVGAGAGELRIIGTAGLQGFSATTSDLVLQLGSLQWGQTNFFTGASTGVLSLGTASSSAVTELASSLDLNSASTRQITVVDNTNSGADRGRITGPVTSSIAGGTLLKAGSGLLELTGAGNNTNWQINAGAIRAGSAAITSGNINLNGGSFESTGAYAATLGTGAGQVRFGAAGGFSAGSSQLNVTLNGGSALVWNSTANFLVTGNALLLNTAFSESRVVITNSIDLNAVARTFTVNDNPNSAGDVAEISGAIIGTANTSRLLKNGTGTLILTGNNTYAGNATIAAGTLQIGDGGTTGSIVTAVANRGVLVFNRSDNLVYGGVISDTGALVKRGGGALILTGASTLTGGTTVSEGTLQIGNAGTTGSLAGNVVNNAVFAFNRTNALTFTGAISGTGAVAVNSGTVELTAANSYSGTTTVAGGTLRVTGDAQTYFFGGYTGNIALAADAAQTSIIQGFGTLQRPIGAGNGQIRFLGTGGTLGFSATTADLTLDFGSLQWGSTNFFGAGSTGGLQLGQNFSTAVTTLLSSIDLNTSTTRAITVGDNTAVTTDRTVIAGAVTSSIAGGTLVKNGAGLLEFTSAGNTAAWEIAAGQVRSTAAAATTGNILLSGGVWETSGSITRRLGTADGQIRWSTAAGGGFAAVGGPLTVNIDTDGNLGTLNALTWGAANFVPTGSALILGSNYATDRVTLQNPLAIANGNRAITVNDNPNTSADVAVLTGVISGNANGRIAKNGAGTLISTADNTYGGATTISTGTFQLGEGGTTGSVAGTITNNSLLVVDRSNLWAFTSTVSGTGSVVKRGAGNWELAGVNTYTGATTIEAGRITVTTGGQVVLTGGYTVAPSGTFHLATGGTTSGDGIIQVSGSAPIDNGGNNRGTLIIDAVAGSGTTSVQVHSGGLLHGSGTLNGSVLLESGGGLAAGDSVGTLTINSSAQNVWEGGSHIYFEFKNAGGSVAGADWDWLNLGATQLFLDATAIDRINLHIDSWLSDNTGHGLNDFNPTSSYSWKFASTGGITFPGPDAVPDLFTIVDSTPGAGVFGTGNPYSLGQGSFYVSQTGNDLFINYSATAVPEPTSFALAGLAAAGLYLRRRKRIRAANGQAEASSPLAEVATNGVADRS
jgi:autotransporter-associated beta strand protein